MSMQKSSKGLLWVMGFFVIISLANCATEITHHLNQEKQLIVK